MPFPLLAPLGVCTLGDGDVFLREMFVPGGPAFGSAGRVPHARVTFDADERATAVLRGDGVVLNVELERSEVAVFARRRVHVAPWLVASTGALPEVGPAHGGQLAIGVSAEALTGLGLARDEAVWGSASCGSFGLNAENGGSFGGGRTVDLWAEDGAVPLFDDDGTLLGEVTNGYVARVLRDDGDTLKVRAWLAGNYEALGWVDTPDTRPRDSGRGGLGFGMSGSGGGCALEFDTRLACAEPLPLSVRVEGSVYRIGEIEAGTAFIVLGEGVDVVPIELPYAWFAIYDGFYSTRGGAELVVPAGAAGCPTAR